MDAGARLSRRRFLGGSLAGAGLVVVPAYGTTAAGGVAMPTPAGAPTPQGQPAASPRAVGGYLLGSPVYGGELQYFRMSPSAIPGRLALCQQAAYTVIQTYVPWNVHEFIPGQFDFTGKTHPVLPNDHHVDPTDTGTPISGLESGRQGTLGIDCNTDLQSFLTLCRDAGFKVILRPGPFISDEWNDGGLPTWFLETAPPDMFMYGPVGGPLTPGAPFGSPPEVAGATGGMSFFYFAGPSYASPSYLAGVQRWFGAFADFVRPWLSSNGGPVVAVQVDDETCYYYNFGPFAVDYNPVMVERFRASTGMRAPRRWPDPTEGVAGLRPAFAWQRFKGEQIGAYLATLRGYLQRAGVDVPITHEIELSLAPPADVAADAAAVLVNPELYPGANGPEAMPLVELTANAIRAAQRNRINVWSAETQSGQVLLYSLLLGEGIIGSLQFTYAVGVPDGAVASTGLLGQALRTAGPLLTESTRRADVAILWDNDLTRAPYGSQRWGFRTDVRAVIERHVPALATLLLRAGYAFDLLDAAVAEPGDYTSYPTILLAASDIMPRAAQQALVSYVRHGGRLVCWAAPPTLDEDLQPCTVLADACFPEATAAFHPQDTQTIELLGQPVTTYLGVQTFALSKRARPVALRSGEPCGYERRSGSGTAVLLGSWLAADSVPQRAGEVLTQEPVPAAVGVPAAVAAQRTLASARLLAERYFGPQLAAALPSALPGGPAETLIVYAYTNQRRGGEYISGGSIAYWNGQHVVGLAELNSAHRAAPVQTMPYRPADASHVQAVRALAAVVPHVEVSDLRIQARVLDAAEPGIATVVANNRWAVDVPVVLTTRVGPEQVRLPTRGSYVLSAKTGVVMPIGYPLGNGATVVQATAQLLSVQAASTTAVLKVWTPTPGELVVRLPAPATRVEIDGRPVSSHAAVGTLVLDVPTGTSTICLGW